MFILLPYSPVIRGTIYISVKKFVKHSIHRPQRLNRGDKIQKMLSNNNITQILSEKNHILIFFV